MVKEIWDHVEIKTDNNVSKLIFTKDTAVAEAVLYRYPTYSERTVICCSTQSGCPIGCRFCGAGDHFVRSLTSDEIISQVKHCLDKIDCKINEIKKLQIMFMSMGEPFLNIKSLVESIKSLNSNYPNAKLLVSTSAPKIHDNLWKLFMDEAIQNDMVGLQFSIHETDENLRNELIPFEAKMNFTEILDKGIEFLTETNRKPYFNYCAHENNTSDMNAEDLTRLFPPDVFCATVSVICERNEGMTATNDYQKKLATDFGNKLLAKGFDVRVFDPAGQNTIGGGCGQLWFVQNWFEENETKTRKSIGYGKPSVHVPSKYFEVV